MTENENGFVNESEENEAKVAAAENTAKETSAENMQANETAADYTTVASEAAANEETASAAQQRADHVRYNPYTGQPYAAEQKEAPKTEEPKKTRAEKKHGFLKKACAAVALALIFGVVSGAVFSAMNGKILKSAASGETEESTAESGEGSLSGVTSTGNLKSSTTLMAEALKEAQLEDDGTYTIPEINVLMLPAMVSVNCTVTTTSYSMFGGSQSSTSESAGSGIIVGENDTELLMVTNNHVVSGADSVSVQFVDGSNVTAYVKGTDSDNDLAVIVCKLSDISESTMSSIAYAKLGDSDQLVVGETVVAIGNALGYGQSVTSGIVSALNRAVTSSDNITAYLIQTDAAINPGNSGGALVNLKGEVVGINSSKFASTSIEGMGFAIPINTALPVIEELMTKTTRTTVEENSGYLGISVTDISSTAQQYYGMPAGVYVSDVTSGSAAENAGIIKGDIITAFDGETVASSSGLSKLLTYYAAGETVEITVQRYNQGEYEEVKLSITLDAKPTEDDSSSQSQQGSGRNSQGNSGSGSSIWDYFYGNGSSYGNQNGNDNGI